MGEVCEEVFVRLEEVGEDDGGTEGLAGDRTGDFAGVSDVDATGGSAEVGSLVLLVGDDDEF